MSAITLSRTWQNRITHGRGLARRLAVALLATGALIGFAAGVKVFLGPAHPNDTDVAAIAYRVNNQGAAAGQFAANFVAAVLSTPESRRPAALQRFITLPAADPTPPAPAVAEPPAAVIEAPRVWSVVATGAAGEASLYSVIVLVAQRPYASAPPTMAFYRVPMSIWRYQPRAMDMPTPISDPGPGADITLAYDHPLSPSNPVYAVVAGFISTYLTSVIGLDRYVVADSWIRPVGGYQSAAIRTADTDVEVPDQPAPGTRIHLRASVIAQTSQFARIPFTFPLTVENSGGTWMIADIDSNLQTATSSDTTPAGTQQP